MYKSKIYLDPELNHEPKKLERYEWKIVIVDALNRIYKQTIGSLQQDESDKYAHIKTTFKFVVGLIKFKMLPIFVFDGKAPKEKSATIQKRSSDRKMYKKKYLEGNDVLNNNKYYKKSFYLDKTKIDECKKVLNLLGICYVNAIEEADIQCAQLARYYEKYLGGVITDDFDVLMCGSPVILQDFSFNNNKIFELNRNEILNYLCKKTNDIRSRENKNKIIEFTEKNFLEFFVLIGTDYCTENKNFKINEMTKTDLFELFALNDLNIQSLIIELINRNILDEKEFENFIYTLNKIINVYQDSQTIDPKSINIIPSRIQIEEITQYLCNYNILSSETILSELETINENYQILKLIYSNINNIFSLPEQLSYQAKYYKKRYQKIKTDDFVNTLKAIRNNIIIKP